MALIARAEAADGYTVPFTMAELDPQFGQRGALVAGRRLPRSTSVQALRPIV